MGGGGVPQDRRQKAEFGAGLDSGGNTEALRELGKRMTQSDMSRRKITSGCGRRKR